MRKGIVLAAVAVILTTGWIASPGNSATAQDPLPATVEALQTRVAALSTSVAEQGTQIADLQTAVAEQGIATPIAQPDPETMTITVAFRADPADIVSTGLGEECSGQGKFRDFGEEADIGIYTIDEELLVAAELTGSELTHDGQIFDECTMTFLLADIPYQEEYLIGITNRSVLKHTHEELAEMDWMLMLRYMG